MNRIPSLHGAVLLMIAVLTLTPAAGRAEDAKPKADAPPASSDAAPRRERRATSERLDAARNRRDAMMAELGLTDEQRDKLRAAQKDQAEKLRAVREDSSLSREQKAAKAREMRDSLVATTKTILTPEQFEKWQKNRETRRPRPGQPAQEKPQDSKPAAGQ
ncbi:MAG: hypothetical protein J0L84_01195 [Verrucomicrobia bacterium]|nr:hypothetical protein [Verrucomicrobiota bacterium]